MHQHKPFVSGWKIGRSRNWMVCYACIVACRLRRRLWLSKVNIRIVKTKWKVSWCNRNACGSKKQGKVSLFIFFFLPLLLLLRYVNYMRINVVYVSVYMPKPIWCMRMRKNIYIYMRNENITEKNIDGTKEMRKKHNITRNTTQNCKQMKCELSKLVLNRHYVRTISIDYDSNAIYNREMLGTTNIPKRNIKNKK